ncbi:uncharacterized protein LOC126738378 isoform X2 [Anthonomus grandis grandis]|uniref:uncharacterized protein LOC126738378 isoform X2 n=1 Tax=Anthonomus grandis grandis TaxID=2921223 RepID=UPI0021667A48|nr:uncharacterized protein LOC126738378 isoform X2 [Anthonomus grandis grandis]
MMSATAEGEFSALQFEKSLLNLKDSQDSINQCCQWCLKNRQHYKKIVNSWLNVLKRVKIEQRLTLFYLANDVVQYSKRRNYEYVDTWGTAIQKATTMVRDEKVKHKILRIFKIWEQRGVYGEEFISDLCGLISIQPTGPKNDEPHEFQANYVINKIKHCANLEKDTDNKLKVLKEHNPKIQISEGLINTLKDRAHVDDVEKEMDVYVAHMESYVNALKLEIKNRIALISTLRQAESHLESDRKDVKMVAHAYRTFGQKVKIFEKKLEEHMVNLPSPLPSPDINAPSPSPEEDIELPEDDVVSKPFSSSYLDLSAIQYSNPGFYVPPPVNNSQQTNSSTSYNPNYSVTYSSSLNSTTVNNSAGDSSGGFLSNGFTSFLGQNLSFDISNISTTGLFDTTTTTTDNTQTTNSYVTTPNAVVGAAAPPTPVAPPIIVDLTESDNTPPYNPLLPPPMPPFSKNNESGFSFNTTLDMNATTGSYDPAFQGSYADGTYGNETLNNGTLNNGGGAGGGGEYDYQLQTGMNPFPPTPEGGALGATESYDPACVTETWGDLDVTVDWKGGDDGLLDTPESPPNFEKEGYGDPVEYHDSSMRSGGGVADIDQRILPGMGDLDLSLASLRGQDVDHRNLISLTGSPSNVDALLTPPNEKPAALPARGNLTRITPQESLWDNLDQDYRQAAPPIVPPKEPSPPPPLPAVDQDYRLQFAGLEAPPPPPPPPPLPGVKSPTKRRPPPPPPLPAPGAPGDPRLRCGDPSKRSDDDVDDVDMDISEDVEQIGNDLDGSVYSLEPPPPLPDLLDDVDANQFLDEISHDLNEFSNLSEEAEGPNEPEADNRKRSGQFMGPPPPPPPVTFGMAGFPPPPPRMASQGYMSMNQPPGPPPRIGHQPHAPPPIPPPAGGPPHWDNRGGPPPHWTGGRPPAFNNDDDNPYLHDDFGGPPHNFGPPNNSFRGGGGGFNHNHNKMNNNGINMRGGFRGGGSWGRGPWKDRGRGGRGGGRRGMGGGAGGPPPPPFRGRGGNFRGGFRGAF